MPIYTYQCESCGVRFERQQSFNDAPLTRCPECNKKTLRKVYTPVGIVFKGSGFYATDHRSPSGMGPRSAGSHTDEKPAESKPESGSTTTPSDSSAPAKPAGARSGKRPNVLFVFTDQERYIQHWPKGMDLPGHERLMRRGVTFHNHYCPAVMCTSSRAVPRASPSRCSSATGAPSTVNTRSS